jgi:glycosyltransferase involved in cell wall biosynthesis
MSEPAPIPLVSVLTPTFKQADFIRRALRSLHRQTLEDWELVIVDDGSPDETEDLVRPYLDDPRIRYYRLPRNRGLGAALNVATRFARGRYLAYLPSDDVYDPRHLANLVTLLDARPEVHLAYGGIRWAGDSDRGAATLQGDQAVGHEEEFLLNPRPAREDGRLPSGNLLKLVQVMHRRGFEGLMRWTAREEVVSDTLEPDFWRGLLGCGARFAYTGEVSCEWIEHPWQREHNIVAYTGGISRYRQFYEIGKGEWLNWRPTRGWPVDERVRYGRFAVDRELPAPGGLKILMVGELGFNPERVMAFEERGHKLYGLWINEPETWDTTGPFAFGNVGHIPHDRNWRDAVRAIRPDIIYALLNWQALRLIDEVREAKLGIPIVFHFKEGPMLCYEKGLWPALMRILRESAGQVFINEENLEWFQLATDDLFNPARTLILDGDLPKIDWMTGDWAPKLSAQDGLIHTVCSGRPLGIERFADLAAAGIHVHLYGVSFQQGWPNWVREGLESGILHVHPTVEPSDWVRELSQYDAGWFHVYDSHNGGDLGRAGWGGDLNLPARLGTYAAAGLPWIMRDNRPARIALRRIAEQHDVGIYFRDYHDLSAQLRDGARLAELTANMRACRTLFAFDTHVDRLVAFFRAIIETWDGGSAA